MTKCLKDDLERSWLDNAAGWTDAVREGRIESRRLATDKAIVEAVRSCAPRRVLDAGCGEGWLVRALTTEGMTVVGMDASAPLIDAARAEGRGEFFVRSYAEFANNPTSVGADFDAVVFNFSLLEDDAAPALLAATQILSSTGALLIQTVHPWQTLGDFPYQDGWRTEEFKAFGHGFSKPMPWFYRTLHSWISLVTDCGYRIDGMQEPLHPITKKPLSLLIICRPKM